MTEMTVLNGVAIEELLTIPMAVEAVEQAYLEKSKGDAALTKYKVLKQCGDCTLLKVKIETGRTHQIRVHLKSVGAPLVGDDMYGGPITENLSRPALHCAEIFFTHPTTGEKMHFSQELPDDIKAEIYSRLLSRD